MAEVFTFYVNEIGQWVTWLFNWNLYGMPFLVYLMSFVILGILLDFIFG